LSTPDVVDKLTFEELSSRQALNYDREFTKASRDGGAESIFLLLAAMGRIV
jgi:hypothetical protein